MILPLKELSITNIYGNTSNGLHKGLDMISLVGDRNVRAIKPGVVSFVGYDENGFGNYVSIMQADEYKVLYCHLNNYYVKIGDLVTEGQIIGIEGTTGNSTGIHLHLEIRETPYTTNNHINSAEYLGIKNQRGPIEFIESEEVEEKEMIERLISEYGEDVVYEALKNICEKEKNRDIVPKWAKEEFENAVEAGITDESRPQDLATRVETAVMIERAENNGVDNDTE